MLSLLSLQLLLSLLLLLSPLMLLSQSVSLIQVPLAQAPREPLTRVPLTRAPPMAHNQWLLSLLLLLLLSLLSLLLLLSPHVSLMLADTGVSRKGASDGSSASRTGASHGSRDLQRERDRGVERHAAICNALRELEVIRRTP